MALADADDGTDFLAVHNGLSRGVPTAGNEARWQTSLARLAALAKADQNTRDPATYCEPRRSTQSRQTHRWQLISAKTALFRALAEWDAAADGRALQEAGHLDLE
jgi:hypothetical protein